MGQPGSWFTGGWAMALGNLGALSFGLPFAALLVALPAATTGFSPGEAVLAAPARPRWAGALLLAGWAVVCGGMLLRSQPLAGAGLVLGLGSALLRPFLVGDPKPPGEP